MRLPLDPRTLIRSATPGVPDLFSLRAALLTRAAGALATLSTLPRPPRAGARRPDDPAAPPDEKAPR